MPRQPEGRAVQRIRAYLEGRGAFVVKIHGGDNPFQEVGIPDLLVCYRGYFIGLEVKQPGEDPTQVQLAVGRRIESALGRFAIVSSVDDVERLLRKLRRKGSSA